MLPGTLIIMTWTVCATTSQSSVKVFWQFAPNGDGLEDSTLETTDAWKHLRSKKLFTNGVVAIVDLLALSSRTPTSGLPPDKTSTEPKPYLSPPLLWPLPQLTTSDRKDLYLRLS